MEVEGTVAIEWNDKLLEDGGHSRYRYGVLKADRHGVMTTLLVRDDGYRVWAIQLEPVNNASEDWILWADYKQCDFPFIGHLLSDWLMDSLQPVTEPSASPQQSP